MGPYQKLRPVPHFMVQELLIGNQEKTEKPLWSLPPILKENYTLSLVWRMLVFLKNKLIPLKKLYKIIIFLIKSFAIKGQNTGFSVINEVVITQKLPRMLGQKS